MEEQVSKTEYDTHKKNCAHSFEEIISRQDRMERAMFGEKEFDRMGIFEMTTEMYKATMYAKGGQKLFLVLVKVAGGILTLWAAFELFVKGK